MNKEAMLAALKNRKAKQGLMIDINLNTGEKEEPEEKGKSGLAPDSEAMDSEEQVAMQDQIMKKGEADGAEAFGGMETGEEEAKEPSLEELAQMLPEKGSTGLRAKVRELLMAKKGGAPGKV